LDSGFAVQVTVAQPTSLPWAATPVGATGGCGGVPSVENDIRSPLDVWTVADTTPAAVELDVVAAVPFLKTV
jgi:hypothetical protein